MNYPQKIYTSIRHLLKNLIYTALCNNRIVECVQVRFSISQQGRNVRVSEHTLTRGIMETT